MPSARPFRWIRLAALSILVGIWTGIAAESGYRCGVCDRKIERGTVWTLAETNYICDACHEIPRRCIHCRMPVKIGFIATSDGRHICRVHAPMAVVDQREAANVFRAATDELRRLARGEMELAHAHIPVSLFDTDYWSLNPSGGPSDGLHKVGFSQTSRVNGLTNHSIVMLSGQLRETLAAVSAHEYAHLWINENRAPGRVIEPETVEAICELAAWKLMQDRRKPEEQARIEANTYTKGRIHDAIALEQKAGFGAVLDWVRTGTGATLASAGSQRAENRLPEKDRSALAVWRAAARIQPPRKADSIRLTGLVEGKTKTLALINGVAVEAGEAAEIRLGESRIKVLVESIANGTVTIRTNGHPASVELRLEGN